MNVPYNQSVVDPKRFAEIKTRNATQASTHYYVYMLSIKIIKKQKKNNIRTFIIAFSSEDPSNGKPV